MPTIAEQLLIDSCTTGFNCTAQSDALFRQSFLELLYQIQAGGGVGGGTPGGANGDVQFNNAGAFGGFGDYNSGTGLLTLTGNLTVPLVTGNLTGEASLNVLKTGDTMTGPLTIVPSSANTIPLTVSGYSVTGAGTASLFSLAGTWNTTGSPTAIDLDITNTASGAAALLMSLRVGGVSLFSVTKAGTVNGVMAVIAGALTAGSVEIASTGNYTFTGRGYLSAPADGVFTIWNIAANDFGRLQFGGQTAAFPAIGRSTTILQARLADDSAFATFQGILKVSVNATAAAPPVTTHTIPLTDAAGTVYRVPCLV